MLTQCDAIDGVVDGFVAQPYRCFFRPDALLCNATRKTNCLSPIQVNALNHIYNDWYDVNQTYVFTHFPVGGELGYYIGSFAPALPSIATEYFKYTVWNDSNWDPLHLTYADVQEAERLTLASKMQPILI